ncbi:hypothetical protein ACIQ9R_36225 [Streptomyces sp. NPDC094447]|uniref:hypothetical protein n=1 Tax=Streptomyces sp. NPDC094447 TaxID=3366062 RepID=UPI00380D4803
MSRSTVDPSLPLPDRVAAVLGAAFPRHEPGRRDGWLIVPRNGQWAASWELADEVSIEGVQAPKRLELANALAAAGYVVSLPASYYLVFVADRPHDTSGPRYEVHGDTTVLGGLFGGSHIVMDTWTKVVMASFRTPEQAEERSAELEREQALADAIINSACSMEPHLRRADELLGDGYWWLSTEEHSDFDHRPPTVHERADALVNVANAVRRGVDIEQTGRRVAYEAPSGEFDVAWCPKSSAPAVGYFPGRGYGDRLTPSVREAIRLLTDAGLTPARFGEPVSDGGFMVEQEGFKVGVAPLAEGDSPRVWVSLCGRGIALAEHARAVEVLREAGWTVNPTGFDDEGIHEAFPPVGTVVPRREGTTLGHYPNDADSEHVQAAVSLLLSYGFNPAETWGADDRLANGFLVESTTQGAHVVVRFLIDGEYRVGKTTDTELHAYRRALTHGGFIGGYVDGYFQIYARRMVGQEFTDVRAVWEVLNQYGHDPELLHLEGLRVRGHWYTGSVVVRFWDEDPERRQRRAARIVEDLAEAGSKPELLAPGHLRVEVSPEAWEVPAGIGCNMVDHEAPLVRAALLTLEGYGTFGGIFNDDVTAPPFTPRTGFHLYPTGDGGLIVTAPRDVAPGGDPWGKEVVAKQWDEHVRFAEIFRGAGWTVKLLGRRDDSGGTLSVRPPVS